MLKRLNPEFKKTEQICSYQMMYNNCNRRCGRVCDFDNTIFEINHNTQYQNCVFVPGEDKIWNEELCPYIHARGDRVCPWGNQCHNKDTHNMTEKQADKAIRNGTHYLLYTYHGNLKGKTFPTKPPEKPPALPAPVAEAGWLNPTKRHTAQSANASTRRPAAQVVPASKNFPPLGSVPVPASSKKEYASVAAGKESPRTKGRNEKLPHTEGSTSADSPSASAAQTPPSRATDDVEKCFAKCILDRLRKDRKIYDAAEGEIYYRRSKNLRIQYAMTLNMLWHLRKRNARNIKS